MYVSPFKKKINKKQNKQKNMFWWLILLDSDYRFGITAMMQLKMIKVNLSVIMIADQIV